MELTSEQAIAVYAIYIGQWVFDDYDNRKAMLVGVSTIPVELRLFFKVEHKRHFKECKLLLRHISQLTDDEAVEVAKLSGQNFKHVPRKSDFDVFKNSDGNFVIGAIGSFFSRVVIDPQTLNAWQFQYLISIGIAVPLFFAPRHPANGLTAIDLQLAINQTESAG